MSPSNSRLIALVLFCISFVTLFFSLGLGGFIAAPPNKSKPTPSIGTIGAGVKDTPTKIVTYEDGTVCRERQGVKLQCWEH